MVILFFSCLRRVLKEFQTKVTKRHMIRRMILGWTFQVSPRDLRAQVGGLLGRLRPGHLRWTLD